MRKLLVPLFLYALISCSQFGSDVSIDSGEFIDGSNKNTVPAVMWIGNCTATAVSHNTVLTAAHCVVQQGQKSQKICIESGKMANGKCSKALYVPSEFVRGEAMGDTGADVTPHSARDVAVAVFEDNTFSNFFELNTTNPVVGQPVQLVGYSSANLPQTTREGTKRWGLNTIAYTNEDGKNTLVTAYGGTQDTVAVSPGDSGGPLFIECKIAGVASRMSARGNSNVKKFSLHTNLMADNRDFLKNLEVNGAYFCGFSGSDAAKCPVTGRAAPYTPEAGEFPCSPDGSGSDANIYLAISPDQNSQSPILLSFAQAVDEVVLCKKNSLEECTTSEFVVKFAKQIGARYIYATNTLATLVAGAKYVVKAKSQGKDLPSQLIELN